MFGALKDRYDAAALSEITRQYKQEDRRAARTPVQSGPRPDLAANVADTAPTKRPARTSVESRATQEWLTRLAALICGAVAWCPALAHLAGRAANRDGRAARLPRPRGPSARR